MNNSWDIKPKPIRGDASPEPIFVQVGAALTVWETLESSLAEMFDALVSGPASNRVGFVSFIAVSTSSARTEMLKAAAIRRSRIDSQIPKNLVLFVETVSNFGARRNEIAHGRVFKLGEADFMIGPNNTNKNKWDYKKDGKAKFQWSSKEIEYYCDQFMDLNNECISLTEKINNANAHFYNAMLDK